MWIYIVFLLTYSSLYTLIELNLNKNYRRIHGLDKLYLAALVYIHAVIYFIISFSIFFIVLGKNVNKNLILAYIVILLLLLIHWSSNDNKCYLTEVMNELYGFPRHGNFRTPIDIYNNDYPLIAISGTRIQNEYLTIWGTILFSFIIYLTS